LQLLVAHIVSHRSCAVSMLAGRMGHENVPSNQRIGWSVKIRICRKLADILYEWPLETNSRQKHFKMKHSQQSGKPLLSVRVGMCLFYRSVVTSNFILAELHSYLTCSSSLYAGVFAHASRVSWTWSAECLSFRAACQTKNTASTRKPRSSSNTRMGKLMHVL
jgi:hypothetical protein